MNYKVSHPSKIVEGSVNLPASKSISNRLLIIRELCETKFEIDNLSDSEDTQMLLKSLQNNSSTKNVGAAGTSFRFLTALLSITNGSWFLTGTKRMKERPIKPLVDALQKMGGDITYPEKTGFPPIEIRGNKLKGGKISIEANISSQFISALMMIAPRLENGLRIKLNGKVVSIPYLQMTKILLENFGISVEFNDDEIFIANQTYQPKRISVEKDWSAAAYFYSIATLAEKSEILFPAVAEKSIQGDSIIKNKMKDFGVESKFYKSALQIKRNQSPPKALKFNFQNHPDLAQTLAVVSAALKIEGEFSGLTNLKIKETDRIFALKSELNKLDCTFEEIGKSWFLRTPKKAIFQNSIEIETYNDHRMAMAFAPLALKFPFVIIQNPSVVNKSFPGYWNALKRLGFCIEKIGEK